MNRGTLIFESKRYPIENVRFSRDIATKLMGIKADLDATKTIESDIILSGSGIKNVIFNDPATIVIWSDGSKTVVKCQPNDTYSKELGLAMCIAKKYLGNKGNYNKVFKKWLNDIPVETMRKKLINHCEDMICSKCELRSPVCRCGNGTFFDQYRNDGSYDMTDDEIRNAYGVVFGK